MTNLVFLYDYHISKEVITSICNYSKRVGKARIEDVELTFQGDFTQGFLHLKRGGKDTLNGVLYNMMDEDVVLIQNFLDIQYKTKKAKTKVTTGVKSVQTAIIFVPDVELKLKLPDAKYFEWLKLAYSENEFNESMLDKVLARTFIKTYPSIKEKYRLVEKG